MKGNSRDRPWIFRTYAGHSSPERSNALFRENLSKGQAGLSIAFDLPTQVGYDSDHVLAKGEVGRVGVPICHLGDMKKLFHRIPLARMNTSMTINATAPWLLALYVALAKQQSAELNQLRGTVQNDIIKEYLSRGTYMLPPEPSLRLIADVAEYCHNELPKWNPLNVCSYHLQEAGAEPVQELAYALATAIAVLDEIRLRVDPVDFPRVVGRISFFVNAGLRFITEMCKMRAFVELWDEICRQRFGVDNPRYRRFRYGVQVNSLGLTEQQPENNICRILLEMLAVTLSKKARARAVQLPAWNEALGLPRPWDQQWSLRMQQILALETDLLEYEDLFDGNSEIDRTVSQLKVQAKQELVRIDAMGGAISALEHMKQQLVESNARRIRRIESGETTVVGVNSFVATADSPLTDGIETAMHVDSEAEASQIAALRQWKRDRDPERVERALSEVHAAARNGNNIMPASVAAAEAGVTTGEWAAALKSVFGSYRAPTGVRMSPSNQTENLDDLRMAVDDASRKLGRRLKLMIGKPGLDGHSNGAEQIICRARDCGMATVYSGIRHTADEIVAEIVDEQPHLVGLSVLSGSHMRLVLEIRELMVERGLGHIPLVVGGIIPDQDKHDLLTGGVRAVYTPKDFEINQIMAELVALADLQRADTAAQV
ncbi:MAG: methylmalonyl-CoA mutase family protein [Rhodobacteraceae bacterium]|nr:methylmalonyl-CoA mutase family protein [Paracoccaceae bacterium]